MRISIAEDDSSLRRALLSIMQKNNYTADAVDNGGDALDYLMCGSYDAVVLDIMMSVMDGVEVLRRARMAGIETPVLFLTARAEVDDKITGLDAPEVEASLLDDGSVLLSWNAVEGAVEYQIYTYSEETGNVSMLERTALTSFTVASPEKGISYIVQSFSYSAISDNVSATHFY